MSVHIVLMDIEPHTRREWTNSDGVGTDSNSQTHPLICFSHDCYNFAWPLQNAAAGCGTCWQSAFRIETVPIRYGTALIGIYLSERKQIHGRLVRLHPNPHQCSSQVRQKQYSGLLHETEHPHGYGHHPLALVPAFKAGRNQKTYLGRDCQERFRKFSFLMRPYSLC